MWQEIPPGTRLWSEEDWERYFAEQERSNQESDAPPIEAATDWDASHAACPSDPSVWDDDDDEPLGDDDDDDDEFAIDPELEELNEIAAWRAAVDLSDSVYEFVAPSCEAEQGGPIGFILRTLCRESYCVHDYVEAGHKLGYDVDTLCGNIATCLRACHSLDRCIQCLERLGGRGDPDCRRLLVRAAVTRSFLERRIADLRQMVWWQ